MKNFFIRLAIFPFAWLRSLIVISIIEICGVFDGIVRQCDCPTWLYKCIKYFNSSNFPEFIKRAYKIK